MKVLFCTDGSDTSFKALKNFSKWGRDAVVDAICVVDLSFLPESEVFSDDCFENSCSNIASAILDKSEENIKNYGLDFGEKIKYCGETVEGILKQTEHKKYDLILMGSNGKKGLQQWLGSVSRDIINSVKVSTYITKNTNECKKVLFATDGSAKSRFAASEAIKYLNLHDKEIYICIVLENPNLLFLEGALDSYWLMEIENQQNKYATKIIMELQKKLQQYNLKADKFAILQGNPAEKLSEFARQENIDLIITGSRNTGNKHFQSSVSKRILDITPSDVAIFK